jgi:hypothetical protein
MNQAFNNQLTVCVLAGLTLCCSFSFAEVYELRTYTTNAGKLDALNARFRDHTVRLFKKHGIESLGYWVPTDEEKSKNTLIYVIKHKSRDAAKASWKAFIADPEWKKAAKESGVGPLANRPESVYMKAADYSPKSAVDQKGEDAVFELRIYRCNEGKLKNLDARFRDHTIKIFKRHGIQSVAYWHPTDEPDSQDTLIYIVRHQSRDAAKTSWKSFGADEEWQKVAKESQKDGKFLRERPESIYMKATDYSAIR